MSGSGLLTRVDQESRNLNKHATKSCLHEKNVRIADKSGLRDKTTLRFIRARRDRRNYNHYSLQVGGAHGLQCSSHHFSCCGQDLFRDAVDIRIGSTMIYDTSAQAESRFQRCVGEIHVTALNDSPQNIEVQSV